MVVQKVQYHVCRSTWTRAPGLQEHRDTCRRTTGQPALQGQDQVCACARVYCLFRNPPVHPPAHHTGLHTHTHTVSVGTHQAGLFLQTASTCKLVLGINRNDKGTCIQSPNARCAVLASGRQGLAIRAACARGRKSVGGVSMAVAAVSGKLCSLIWLSIVLYYLDDHGQFGRALQHPPF